MGGDAVGEGCYLIGMFGCFLACWCFIFVSIAPRQSRAAAVYRSVVMTTLVRFIANRRRRCRIHCCFRWLLAARSAQTDCRAFAPYRSSAAARTGFWVCF